MTDDFNDSVAHLKFSTEQAVDWAWEVALTIGVLIFRRHREDKLWQAALDLYDLRFKGISRAVTNENVDAFVEANIDHLKPYLFDEQDSICAFDAAPSVLGDLLAGIEPDLAGTMRERCLWGEAYGEWDLAEEYWEPLQKQLNDSISAFGSVKLRQFACELRIEATRVELRTSTTKRPTSRSRRRRRPEEWVAEALLLLQEDPNRRDSEIAEQVGVHPGTLSRSETYQKMREIVKRSPQAGFVTDSGDVESGLRNS